MNKINRVFQNFGRGIAASALCLSLVSCGANEAIEPENIHGQALGQQAFGYQTPMSIRDVKLVPIDNNLYVDAKSFRVSGVLLLDQEQVEFEFPIQAGIASNQAFYVDDNLSLYVGGHCLSGSANAEPCEKMVLDIQYVQGADKDYLATQHGLLLKRATNITSRSDVKEVRYFVSQDREILYYFLTLQELINGFTQ